jgi:hypothetical protein
LDFLGGFVICFFETWFFLSFWQIWGGIYGERFPHFQRA